MTGRAPSSRRLPLLPSPIRNPPKNPDHRTAPGSHFLRDRRSTMPPITRSRARQDRLASLLVPPDPPPLDLASPAASSSLVDGGRPVMPKTRSRARQERLAALRDAPPMDLASSAISSSVAALVGPPPLDLVSSSTSPSLVEGGRAVMPRTRSRARKDRLGPPPLDLVVSSSLVEGGRPAMPRTRSRARREESLERFPEEILEEILARLPARSVLRCRAVCRLWRRLTSDPAFLADHHRHQPELPIIRTVADDDDDTVCHEVVHLRAAELHRIPAFRRSRGSSITASCDGLLVVDDHYICNPATRQWAPISPKKTIANLVGFFRHQPSGEFRVLYHKKSKLPSHVGCENEYRILTVGTNEYRVLTDAPLNCGQGPRVYGAPVLLHGSLHMHLTSRCGNDYNTIMVFHTVAESFRQIRPPPLNRDGIMHLLDMGGTLAVSCSTFRMTDLSIFALQDRERGGWALQYSIKLPVMDIRRFQEHGDWWVKVVSDDGDVLVSCDGWLLHCDRRGGLVARFRYDDEFPGIVPHRLKESLIQHAFFQKTKKKKVSGSPFCVKINAPFVDLDVSFKLHGLWAIRNNENVLVSAWLAYDS